MPSRARDVLKRPTHEIREGRVTETVLVTGGAGYIGSHVVLALREAGFGCVVLDDLSSGRREAVPADVPLVVGDIADRDLVRDLCDRHRIAGVLHFAGRILVEESVRRPLDYYAANTCKSRTFIEAVVAAGIAPFVFSSTAAVYGTPDRVPVDETAPTLPINPYGASKLMTEWMLRDTAAVTGLRPGVLRYFNVAGADPDLRAGQVVRQATHLIKVCCEVAVGARAGMAVHGTDYPTDDGTCVRDYIHVSDLAQAHVLVLRALLQGAGPLTLNCGYGRGHSVREVVAAVSRAAGAPLAVTDGPRRAGDPPRLVAAADRLRALGWQPRFDDLDVIAATALAWERHWRTPG